MRTLYHCQGGEMASGLLNTVVQIHVACGTGAHANAFPGKEEIDADLERVE